MDELAEKIARATSELEATLAEQSGQIDVEGEYREDVMISGDRVGFARLAIELLKAARPIDAPDPNEAPRPDHRWLSSPIVEYKRVDGTVVDPATEMTWKDRLMSTGCVLFLAFAVVAFFRGCAALENDIERLLK